MVLVRMVTVVKTGTSCLLMGVTLDKLAQTVLPPNAPSIIL